MCIYLQDMKFLLSMLSLGQLYTGDTNDDDANSDDDDVMMMMMMMMMMPTTDKS